MPPAVVYSAAALVMRNGLFLSVSKRDNWHTIGMPGGKLEPGESSEQAMVRELKEETGIEAAKYKEVYYAPDVETAGSEEPRICVTYRVTEWRGEPKQQPGDGHVCWVSMRDMTGPLAPYAEYNQRLFTHLITKA